MPSAKEIEQILEYYRQWEIIGEKQREFELFSQDNEASSSILSECTTRMANFVQIAFNLACSAKLVAEMTPIVMQMVEEFSQMSPRLLNGAFSFFKFIESLEPFLDEGILNLKIFGSVGGRESEIEGCR